MDLESEVCLVMQQAGKALTVDQIVQEIAERIRGDVRSVLNDLVKRERLTSVHGGGGYSTHYMASPIERRA